MITQKAKYALKALSTLASVDEGAALRIDEIASRSGAPKRFLEHILLDLKRAGMIASRRGRTGGYALIKDPAKLPLAEVLRLIDGPIAPLACLSRRAYQPCEDCADEASCRIRKVFSEVFYAYLLLIESVTLADLCDRPDEVAWQLPLSMGGPSPD
jgi:Rrf2 family protein